jgi:hypothetical protein
MAKVTCTLCNKPILLATAAVNGGACMPCAKGNDCVKCGKRKLGVAPGGLCLACRPPSKPLPEHPSFESWLEAVLPSRTPDGVVAFNFNITDHESWLVEVIGASSYGPNDKDWACPPEAWKGDHGFDVAKHHAQNWEQALKYIAARVGRFVSRSRHQNAVILREATAVCVGFVDGDLTKVWPAPTPLWPNTSLERTREG